MRKIPIFITVIQHKHGQNIYTATTHQDAMVGVATYVRENWDTLIEGPDDNDDSPLHSAEAYEKEYGLDDLIHHYFNTELELGGLESYEIQGDLLELEDDPKDVETRRHVVHLVGLLQELVNDIEAMQYYDEIRWFGPFEVSKETLDGGLIEWPNLAISLDKAKAYLEPKQEEVSYAGSFNQAALAKVFDGFYKPQSPHWHEHNPWKDRIVYVTLEELAECSPFALVEDTLRNWKAYGDKLDAYLLPRPNGYIECGFRYGADGPNYVALAGVSAKLAALLLKKQTP